MYLYFIIKDHLIVDLVKLADVYDEMNLKTACILTIQRGITVSNAAFVYSKAIEYNEEVILKIHNI